jgi:hypothetical protein
LARDARVAENRSASFGRCALFLVDAPMKFHLDARNFTAPKAWGARDIAEIEGAGVVVLKFAIPSIWASR